MKSLWNSELAQACAGDPLALRVYTSRLLGQNPDLVLHGGGNTSVKATVNNFFGEPEEVLYVKGSGWDLVSIEAQGFPAVRMSTLLKLAQLDSLSDADMVQQQKAAMLDPSSPTPSVEAILHALIPLKFVDHTHADAVVTLTNTPNGESIMRELYGDEVLLVPYIMPGFVLAKKVYELTREIDWGRLKGMILMNHGVFSFADSAQQSYENMIELVRRAQDHIEQKLGKTSHSGHGLSLQKQDLLTIARLRREVSRQAGKAMLVNIDTSARAKSLMQLDNMADAVNRGPLTPDHVIRTKRTPLVFSQDPLAALQNYAKDYNDYFGQHQNGETRLDPAPRWAIWQDKAVLSFGTSRKESQIVSDIKDHTIDAIIHAEALGGWQALPPGDIFDVEYWELEQAKLTAGKAAPLFSGKVALVSGAASGIGKACVDSLLQRGACVIALDISSEISHQFQSESVLGICCDLTDEQQIAQAIEQGVARFGALDLLISNAGTFPQSQTTEQMPKEHWDMSIAINLSSHQRLLHHCLPYLKLGLDPAVVFMGSKNVKAPGPGASAYSVAKAGMTQLARIAALELGEFGIRVNTLHPNAVFDTAIWSAEILQKRAQHYGLSVEQYKRDNVLHCEITSRDVAELSCTLLGPVFAKTTGEQIAIDGGNLRVI